MWQQAHLIVLGEDLPQEETADSAHFVAHAAAASKKPVFQGEQWPPPLQCLHTCAPHTRVGPRALLRATIICGCVLCWLLLLHPTPCLPLTFHCRISSSPSKHSYSRPGEIWAGLAGRSAQLAKVTVSRLLWGYCGNSSGLQLPGFYRELPFMATTCCHVSCLQGRSQRCGGTLTHHQGAELLPVVSIEHTHSHDLLSRIVRN